MKTECIAVLLTLSALGCSKVSDVSLRSGTTHPPIPKSEANGTELRAPSSGQSVDVKQYGARGDNGVTDDTAAFTAAIAAAGPGGSVYVPTGIYQVTGITIGSPLTLYGEGTLKYPANTTAWHLILITRTSNVVLRGITFDGNRAGQTSWSAFRHCVKVEDSSHVSVAACRFVNPIGDGIYMGIAEGAPPPFVGVSDISITRCEFSGSNVNRNGISVSCGQRIWISDCTIRGMATQLMPGAIDFEPNVPQGFVRDVVVTRNTIEDCRAGVLFMNNQHVPLDNFARFTISSNNISHTIGATTDGGTRVYHGSDISITNNIYTGITNGYAISVWGDNCLISGNAGWNCWGGITGAYVTGLRLIGNSFTNSASTVLSLIGCPQLAAVGNTIRGWRSGEYALALLGDCSDYTITNNIFDGVKPPIAAIHISTNSLRGKGSGNLFRNCTEGAALGADSRAHNRILNGHSMPASSSAVSRLTSDLTPAAGNRTRSLGFDLGYDQASGPAWGLSDLPTASL